MLALALALALAAPSPTSLDQAKLNRLAEGPANPIPRDLPGVVRFLGITGDTKDARTLYVEMMKSHADIVEAFEEAPEKGNRLFTEFLDQAMKRTQAASGFDSRHAATFKDHGGAALFLFVRTHPKFEFNPEHNNVMVEAITADKIRGALKGPKAVPAIKALFLHWLTKEPNTESVCYAFSIAEDDGVEGALPAALKVIADPETPNEYKAGIMMTYVEKYGTQENLKDLAPFLSDAEDFGFSQLNNEPMIYTQFRDVALAVSVHISGQKLNDYGIKKRFDYGYPNDQARKEAFEKWDAWVKKSPVK